MEDDMTIDEMIHQRETLTGNQRAISQDPTPLEVSKRTKLFVGKRGYRVTAGFVCVLTSKKGQPSSKGRIKPKCIFFLGEDKKWHQLWTTSASHSNCEDECVSFEYVQREMRYGISKYFDVCEGEGLSFDEMIAIIINAYGAKYGTVIEEVPPEIWYGQFGETLDAASDHDPAKRQKMGPSILDALDKIGVKEKDRLIRELYAENHRLLEENLAQTMIIEEQKRTNQRLLDCLSQIQE